MKYLFSKLLLTLIFIVASNIIASAAGEAVAKDSTLSPHVIVKDIKKYSPEFLDGLINSGMSNKFRLIDDKLIIDSKDTSRIPSLVDKPVTLTACSGKNCYTLTVEKVNYTTLKYKCEITKDGKTMTLTGNADVSPLFFLSTEMAEDETNGTSFPVYEYSEQNKECFFSFRLGNNNKVLSAKIIMTCKDETKNVTLENSPMLKVK